MGKHESPVRRYLRKIKKFMISFTVFTCVFVIMPVVLPFENMPSDIPSGSPALLSADTAVPDRTCEGIPYDRSAALAYAAAHWNDGVGDCSDFCAACLRAGGIPADMCGATNIMDFLVAEYGREHLRELVLTDGKFRMSDNIGNIEAGDPVFWYCEKCGKCGHTSICSGADNDILVDYAHNNRHDGHVALWTGAHRDGICRYSALYAFHFGEVSASDLPSALPAGY